MKKRFLIVFFLNLIILSGILFAQLDTLQYDGLNRTYLLHVPRSYNKNSPMPLVVALHNAYGGAVNFESMTGFSTRADESGFIVVYPGGTGSPTSWNAGGCCLSAMTNNIDDVGFISILIDTISENYNIDPDRVYAAGFSNGSIMAYRLAAELSHKIAAIAAASGQMMLDEIDPDYPVPIIHFHALDDQSVPYNGGYASGCNFPSVESVIDIWIGINNCTTEPDTFINEDGIIGTKWVALDNNADIVLFTRPTGGHSWPANTISATDTIWNFFKDHPMQHSTDIVHKDSHIIKGYILEQNFPNPFNPATRIGYSIESPDFVSLKVYDVLGREIRTLISGYQMPGKYSIRFDAAQLSSGIYFYRLQVGSKFVEMKKMLLMR